MSTMRKLLINNTIKLSQNSCDSKESPKEYVSISRHGNNSSVVGCIRVMEPAFAFAPSPITQCAYGLERIPHTMYLESGDIE